MSFTLDTKIREFETGSTIPGASIVISNSDGTPRPINGNIVGRKADADGRVIIPVAYADAYIKVSGVGREPLVHPAEDYISDDIYLSKKAGLLKTVVVKASKLFSGDFKGFAELNDPTPTRTSPSITPPVKKNYTWLIVLGAVAVAAAIAIIIKNRK